MTDIRICTQCGKPVDIDSEEAFCSCNYDWFCNDECYFDYEDEINKE